MVAVSSSRLSLLVPRHRAALSRPPAAAAADGDAAAAETAPSADRLGRGRAGPQMAPLMAGVVTVREQGRVAPCSFQGRGCQKRCPK